ncbi:MAG: hypothetical protein PHF79_02155 [Candidatus Pacebacteria bacterium]|nr:hypothetical protein [Candidatus Paceibacterota bacterium]
MKNFRNEIEKIYTMLVSGKKFSFSKYADGEWSIMKGRGVNNKEFSYRFWDRFYKNKLIESFKFKDSDYYVGISCYCCQGDSYYKMKEFSGQDEDHLTFANIFVNSNYSFYKENFINEYKKRDVILVANVNAKIERLPFKVYKFYPVGFSAWKKDYDLIGKINMENYTNKLFLFACGPLGNLLAHQLWVKNKDNTYLDIGSTLNPWLESEGFKRDYYLDGECSKKVCIWK